MVEFVLGVGSILCHVVISWRLLQKTIGMNNIWVFMVEGEVVSCVIMEVRNDRVVRM